MLQYYLAQIQIFIPRTHKCSTKKVNIINCIFQTGAEKEKNSMCEGYPAGQQHSGNRRLRQ